ncbi:FAD:protein FMN transferase [Alicyclobacillus mali]|uniref:FAD:protein FMN transferase n=1 Tax=Alicyclobacillus mali (ex Roth et al. 2021) TaxID=1123961 RepID=A0ABS0F5A6_9BACL|nr:FAD:protein FMN transferase [Alicyclobacillus mali (ex Roth et al. 2021)]MBF8378457.1 FAD:protein FMN transferase [Alicyclobacillus mali (ex Roth et al. 2021)]
MQSTAFRAMGTDVEFFVEDWLTGPDLASLACQLEASIRRYERIFSRFDPASHLSRLNRQAGCWLEVPAELYEVLQLAAHWFEQTRGYFDPFVGEDMRRIGYSVSFDQLDVTVEPILASTRVPPLRPPIELGPGSAVRLQPGYEVDLGGIAKGFIVARCTEELRAQGLRNFALSAGGDVQVVSDTEPWPVRVANPFGAAEPIGTLVVQRGGVATSGTYKRRWQTPSGRVLHHLLDPFTGLPADTDALSVSVCADELTTAEVLAKVALLLGADGGTHYLDAAREAGLCSSYLIATTKGDVILCN